MTKAELITRTIDAMVDPWTDNPEDYLHATPIFDTEEARDMLTDLHAYDIDLDPEDILPDEVTPEVVMEAYNCLIRARKFEVRVHRLAEWIVENDPVCEYANYYFPENDDAIDMCPVDFIWDQFPFDMKDDMLPNPLVLIELGQRSPEFNPSHEYCWYDKEKNQLFSCDRPFREGVLDAEAFARFILLDAETFGYMFDHIIDDEDATHILGCTKEEYINE